MCTHTCILNTKRVNLLKARVIIDSLRKAEKEGPSPCKKLLKETRHMPGRSYLNFSLHVYKLPKRFVHLFNFPQTCIEYSLCSGHSSRHEGERKWKRCINDMSCLTSLRFLKEVKVTCSEMQYLASVQLGEL